MRNLFSPRNKKPGYSYCWVFDGNHGYEITESTMMGYEAVKKDDGEIAGRVDPEGNLRFGDTILMRIREDELEEIQEIKKDKDYRLSGQAEDEAFDDMVKTKSKGTMQPFNFRSTEELKSHINKKGAN